MYYIQIQTKFLNVKNGAELSDAATAKYTVSGKSTSTVSAGSIVSVDDLNTVLSVSVVAASGYSVKSISVEASEYFKGKRYLSKGENSGSETLEGFDLSSMVNSAQTMDEYIQISCYVYVDSLTKTLTYNLNGGSDGPQDSTFTANVSFRLSTTAPTKEGSTFYGWTVAGTETRYTAGATVTFDSDTTLYAMWSTTEWQEEKFENSLVYKT